jgi:HEPN domain-containing protein
MSWSSGGARPTVVQSFVERLSSVLSERGGRSLKPEEAEEARRLMTAARSDLRAAKLLATDDEQSADVIGFHAQQAVEKAIKAVLVGSDLPIHYTHDLGFLLEVLGEHAIAAPDSVASADWLTPWAVAARYGASDAALDREAAVLVADEAVRWAATTVGMGA